MRFDFQVSLLELKKATPTVQSVEMSTQVTTKTGSARGCAYSRVKVGVIHNLPRSHDYSKTGNFLKIDLRRDTEKPFTYKI